MDSDQITRYVPEHRRRGFKNRDVFSPEQVRRRHEDAQVEIRKARRFQNSAKRRNIKDEFSSLDYAMDADTPTEVSSDSESILRQKIESLLNNLLSQKIENQLNAVKAIRNELTHTQFSMNAFCEGEIILCLVNLLESTDDELKLHVVWCITNIASGDSRNVKALVDAGSVPKLMKLLGSKNADIMEQAIWALGNISGDSSEFRDVVLSHNVLPYLLKILSSSSRIRSLRLCTWVLSNLCRGKNPSPDWEKLSIAVPTFAQLIYSVDEELLVDACWCIARFTEGSIDQIQKTIDAGIPRRLVELLNHERYEIHAPVLRAIGNIVSGDDLQTQIVINCGCLSALKVLLNSPKHDIQREVCWTISNIAAGNTCQIEALISSGIIPRIIELIDSSDANVRAESAWVITNLSAGGLAKPGQINYVVEHGCLKKLYASLNVNDVRMTSISLLALENILACGEKEKTIKQLPSNPFASTLFAENGTEKFYSLLNSDNMDIFDSATRILDIYVEDSNDIITESTSVEPTRDTSSGLYHFNENPSLSGVSKFNF